MKRSLFFARLDGTRAFILLFSLYCIGLAGIIRADRLYLDDMGRALYGYADMAPAGRALADLLSGIFYLHPGTVDASPFSQLAAAALTACSALLLCRALRFRLTPAVVAACLPFGLGPYGLENLSYRFDAPLTAAGILFAVLPYSWLLRKAMPGVAGRQAGVPLKVGLSRRKAEHEVSNHKGIFDEDMSGRCPERPARFGGEYGPRIIFFAGASLCVFASASVYQPCVNIYAAIAVFVVLRTLSRGRGGSAASALRFGAPFLCGSALYVLQLPLWLDDYRYGAYVASHSATPGPALLPGTAAENVRGYFAVLYGDWSVNALGPLLVLAVAGCCAVSALRLKRRCAAPGRSGSGSPFLSAAVLPVLFACLVLAPLGVQIVLSSPVWSPRTFVAFGPVLTLILLGITPAKPATGTGGAAKAAALALILLIDVQLFIIASLYGNMLSAQNRWEQARFADLAPVLAAFAAEKHSGRVVFAGSAGYTPLMDVPGRRFPLIRRMTVVPLTRDMRWGYEQLKIYGVAARPGKAPEEGDILRPYADTPFFRLDETPDGGAFVTFKQAPVCRNPL